MFVCYCVFIVSFIVLEIRGKSLVLRETILMLKGLRMADSFSESPCFLIEEDSIFFS